MKTLRLTKNWSNKKKGDAVSVDGATAGNLVSRGIAIYSDGSEDGDKLGEANAKVAVAEAEIKKIAAENVDLKKQLTAVNKKLEAAEKKLKGKK